MTLLHERELALVLALALGGCGGSEFSAGDSAGAGGAAGNASGGAAGSATGGAAGTASGGSAGNPSGGAAGSSGGAAGAAGGGGNCPDDMVAFQGQFCIDKHEATQEEYEKFLVAVGTTPSGAQPVGCQANSSFHPNDHCAGYFQPQTKWNHAVGCVDWCDAYAYCKWAGKHLCSSVSGQVLTAQTFEDYSASQWGYACSNGGQTDYPYGATLQPQNCMSTVDSAPVGSYAQCTGLAVPFNQVFDMVGSVAEWIDYCDVNQGCALMGRLDTPNDKPSSCTANTYALKLTASETTGIRCCL